MTFIKKLVSPLNSGANAAPLSVQAYIVTTVQALMFAVVALKQPAIECLTYTGDEWGYLIAIVTLGTVRPEDSGAVL